MSKHWSYEVTYLSLQRKAKDSHYPLFKDGQCVGRVLAREAEAVVNALNDHVRMHAGDTIETLEEMVNRVTVDESDVEMERRLRG